MMTDFLVKSSINGNGVLAGVTALEAKITNAAAGATATPYIITTAMPTDAVIAITPTEGSIKAALENV
jgi:hypothetical protein